MAKIDDLGEMLKTLINSVNIFKQEVFKRFDEVDKRFDEMDKKFEDKIDGVETRLIQRIDKIGKQLAYLEDDAPTREEFNSLEKRVDKIEHKSFSKTA